MAWRSSPMRRRATARTPPPTRVTRQIDTTTVPTATIQPFARHRRRRARPPRDRGRPGPGSELWRRWDDDVARGLAGRWPAGQCPGPGLFEPARFFRLVAVGPLGELRHHLLGEKGHRLADVLVSGPAALAHEDELVHPGLLVGAHQL